MSWGLGAGAAPTCKGPGFNSSTHMAVHNPNSSSSKEPNTLTSSPSAHIFTEPYTVYINRNKLINKVLEKLKRWQDGPGIKGWCQA